MKKFNKMLVVLPLVLVFVLSSLPVFGWSDPDKTLTITLQLESADGHTVTTLPDKRELKFSAFPEDKYTDSVTGAVLWKKVLKKILETTAFEGYYPTKADLKDSADFNTNIITPITNATDDTTATLVLKEVKPAEDPKPTEEPKNDPYLYKCVAIDKVTKKVVWTEITELTNKNGALSWLDLANEYYNWEVAAGNKLKDYYLLGFAPDLNLTTSQEEAELMAKYKVNFMIWVAAKQQPLTVTHVFPDRTPMLETIMVDYFVKYENRINEYNAAEIAKTRVQKMNELGYVFEKAEYVPLRERQVLMREARDAWGQKIDPNQLLSKQGIFIYYKGAPIPAPVPVVDSQKKVDAATAQTPAQTGVVNTNVQANVQAPAAPVTAAGQQLPATGVADNAFLFLSSAALMALGIFFFKKH